MVHLCKVFFLGVEWQTWTFKNAEDIDVMLREDIFCDIEHTTVHYLFVYGSKCMS